MGTEGGRQDEPTYRRVTSSSWGASRARTLRTPRRNTRRTGPRAGGNRSGIRSGPSAARGAACRLARGHGGGGEGQAEKRCLFPLAGQPSCLRQRRIRWCRAGRAALRSSARSTTGSSPAAPGRRAAGNEELRAVMVPLTEIQRHIPPLWRSLVEAERVRADARRAESGRPSRAPAGPSCAHAGPS